MSTHSLLCCPLQSAGGKWYSYLPELALVLPGGATPRRDRIEVAAAEYALVCSAYDRHKEDQFEHAVTTNISIVPTGYCEGGCSYCYAKDGWSVDTYLTPQQFDTALELNGVQAVGSVIIYGGEPVHNFPAFERLIKHLINERGVTSLCTCTSMFYDDETFIRLQRLIKETGKSLSWSVSCDSSQDPRKYLRRYRGTDTYAFIRDRFYALAQCTDQVGVRLTVSTVSPNPFDLLDEFEAHLGAPPSSTLEMVKYNEKLALRPDQFSALLWRATDYIRSRYYTESVPDHLKFKPFAKALRPNSQIFGTMRGCDMGLGRVTIMPDGGVSSCSEDVRLAHPAKLDLRLERPRMNDFKGVCKTCDYKYSCNLTCFTLLATAPSDSLSREHFCQWHQFNMVAGLEYRFSRWSDQECDAFALDSTGGQLHLEGYQPDPGA